MKSIFKKVATPILKKLTATVLIAMISIAGLFGNTAFAASDTVKYTYDESGNRIMKEENGKKTYYVNKYYEEDSDGTTRKFVYANGVKVSTITTHPDKSVSTVYHHSDHLGGSNVSTDTSGKVVEVNDYFPYGSSRIDERTGGYENNKLYTGKELDRNTGLYYYGARYYDPLIGRFTSIDPWGGDITDPQSLNKYAYTENNPVKNIDPNGKSSENFILKLQGLNNFCSGCLEIPFKREIAQISQSMTNFFSALAFTAEAALDDISDPYGALMGKTMISGEKLSTSERVGSGIAAFIPLANAKMVNAIGKTIADYGFKHIAELRKFRDLIAKGLSGDTAAKKAKETLDYIKKNNGSVPKNYKGGSQFDNKDGLLPKGGSYKKYDITPKTQGTNRSSERIIIDQETNNSWYTPDHYESFEKIE